MRNRPDISYLTLLGLSLSVVIAMQKGDSCEDRVRFKLSDADGHHICFLSADAVKDAFLAVSNEKSSFVFGHNAPSYNALNSSIKVLVDIKVRCFIGTIPSGIDLIEDHPTRKHIPDFCGEISLRATSVKPATQIALHPFNRSKAIASLLFSAIPVRAGPEWTI